MISHFIFMSSSYTKGTRIALDYLVDNENVEDVLLEDFKKIIDTCGSDVSISTHLIQANDSSWEAVCKADSFFDGVEVISSLEEFIHLINLDRELSGVDIAKYILSKIECTHLKLQKLVYLCFAEYLYKTGKLLFAEKIYAFKYGPVIKSVYERYKKYSYNMIEEEKEIKGNANAEMPAKSRILFAKDGVEKIISIDETLNKYGNYTATQLVNLTHKKDSPWTRTPRSFFIWKSEISVDIIKQYHVNEM